MTGKTETTATWRWQLHGTLVVVKKNESLFTIAASPKQGKKDVVATKVFKVFEFLQRHLTLHEFIIKDGGWHYDPALCVIYFVLDNKPLPETMLRQGPPISNEVASTRFKEVHKEVFQKGDRLYAEVKREFTDSKECILHLLNQDYVKERVANIKLD